MRVPTVTENSVTLNPMARERIRPADFGEGREMVQGVQRLAGETAQFVDAQDRLHAALDDAGAKTIDNDYVTAAQGIRAGFLSTQGLSAGTARAGAEQALTELTSSTLAKATTQRMRAMATSVIERRAAGMRGEFAGHVSTQLFKAEDDASLARLGLAGEEAAATSDPSQRQMNIDTGLSEIAARGARLGWAADATKAESLKFTSGVHRQIAENYLIADDVDGAANYLKAHRDTMTGADDQRIGSMLRDPLIRRETNGYVDSVMGTATGGETSASFSYSDPLHGIGKSPVPGGQFAAKRDYGGHQGADIPAPINAPVFSSQPGVARVSTSKLGGNIVTVDDGNGHVTRYMHLGKIAIKDGDRVTPDTQIGAVGMSGRSTGPHLHYEVMQDGKHVDPTKVVGTVQQAPQRHDLNRLLARVDADASLTPEQRDRYKTEIERRVGRDEQLLNRQEDEAQRQALDAIAKMGPNGFTDMSKIPANIRAGVSSQFRVTLMNMAESNAKSAAAGGGEPKANGETAFNLNMMALYQPDAFKALDLRAYQTQIRSSELEGLAKQQAQLRLRPPEATDHGKIWGVVNRYAPDLGLDLGASKGKPNKPADRAAAQRIFAMVQADLGVVTGGNRQATDDEVQHSYDRAVRQVVVNGNNLGENNPRAFQLEGRTAQANVPDTARQGIVAAFRKRYGRQPNEGEIARYWAQR